MGMLSTEIPQIASGSGLETVLLEGWFVNRKAAGGPGEAHVNDSQLQATASGKYGLELVLPDALLLQASDEPLDRYYVFNLYSRIDHKRQLQAIPSGKGGFGSLGDLF